MEPVKPGLLASARQYPYVTRRLIHLYNKGVLSNVSSVDIEPVYGYVTRINYFDGSHRITRGSDLGLNPGAACELAKDKGYSKFMLRLLGIECPEGDEFLLPHWAAKLRGGSRQLANGGIKTTDESDSYIRDNLGYPVYVKPVDGSQGTNVFKVYDEEELSDVFRLYDESKVRVALIERPVDMPDYRIVILDRESISAYRRIPLTIVGDGKRTITQLVIDLQREYVDAGRDTKIDLNDSRITAHLIHQGMTPESKPAVGEEVTLVPISNLSAGGRSVDVSRYINSHWVDLAVRVASNFNLRLCGIDLACKDINDASSSYCVLEVNGTPGLDHFASAGEEQQKIVDDLYTKVLNTPG